MRVGSDGGISALIKKEETATWGQRERWHPSADQEGRPQHTRPDWHPDLRIPASRTGRNTCLLWKPPSLWYFAIVAGAKKTDSLLWMLLGAPCSFNLLHRSLFLVWHYCVTRKITLFLCLVSVCLYCALNSLDARDICSVRFPSPSCDAEPCECRRNEWMSENEWMEYMRKDIAQAGDQADGAWE